VAHRASLRGLAWSRSARAPLSSPSASAAEGKGSLAVGNIAGTNTSNILFILGLSAALRPLPLQLQSIKLDVPIMIAAAVGLFVMAWDGSLGRTEGAILVASIQQTHRPQLLSRH
jgi:Ca2+/Na+ antiporter